MEADECYYCKKRIHTTSYRNPYTKEIHPSCENCIKDFTLFAKEISSFTYLGCFWLPVFIAISLIVIFFNWQFGLFFLAIGILFEIAALILKDYFLKKKERACGTYIDPRKI